MEKNCKKINYDFGGSMKNSVILIALVIFIGFAILSESNIVLIAAGICMTAVFIKCIYKYNKTKKQISEISFKLKRGDLADLLISVSTAMIAIYDITNMNVNGIYDLIVENKVSVLIVLYVLIYVYVYVFQKPILAIEGLLCGNGDFIGAKDIKTIMAEDDFTKLNKKVNVIIKTDKGYEKMEVFKVKQNSYEQVKRHIQSCVPAGIVEK